MTDYAINVIRPEHVRHMWPKAKEHLQSAIERTKGRWKQEYILASLVLGEYNLWTVTDSDGTMDGAVITERTVYPEKVTLMIHFMGGKDFDAWHSKLKQVMTSYATDAGCASIECLARAGFWKWFKNDGFEKTAVYYEKELKEHGEV